MTQQQQIQQLKEEIKQLKKDLAAARLPRSKTAGRTVIVPPELKPVFDEAEKNVGKYHRSLHTDPAKATIEISGQRYLLVRASALSIEFLEGIMNYYRERGDKESLSIGKNILFDLAHQIGVEDARNFSKLMGLQNPLEMLSAGPVHFAYTGWAQVRLMKGSNPTPDKNYVIYYAHPYSFEADSWIKAGKPAEQPVCVMNSGYSSGWCSYSFGLNLTAVEITCKARGDKECTFVMAPPDRIQQYLKAYPELKKNNPEVPTFLQRKLMEEKLADSLEEKELLLKEVHHRVKNNLQIISSLLNLQLQTISDADAQDKFRESINRIRSMAHVHELLYRSKNFSGIPVSKYFPSLIASLKDSFFRKEIKIELELETSRDKMDIDKAIPCGLILNELVSNAIKYAFYGRKSGLIKIHFTDKIKGTDKKFRMVVSDNGIGIVQTADIRESQTLGMQLVHSLVLQLDGTINIRTNKGTNIQIDF